MLPLSSCASASTFKGRILEKPEIEAPAGQFIHVFFQGGRDKDPFGLVTDGPMSVDDWRSVLEHNGYLNPYGVFKPGNKSRWKAHGMHKAMIAAQSMGRATGGSVIGRPKNPSQRMNVYTAYDDPVGMKVTHFFQDDEDDIGTPGGSGDRRLRITANKAGAHLRTQASDAFDLALDHEGDGLNISLGVYTGKHVFGGSHQIIGCVDGWQLKFHNKGGFRGKNRYVLHTGSGSRAESPVFNIHKSKRWHELDIRIRSTGQPRKLEVAFAIDGLGERVSKIKPLRCDSRKLFVGSPKGLRHDIFIDDVLLQTTGSGAVRTIAHHTFENIADADAAQPEVSVPRKITDRSGESHTLTAVDNDDRALVLTRTTGDDHGILEELQQDLVDAIIERRNRAGEPLPELITNWRLSDAPGRFRHARQFGFTNASTEYYHYPGASRRDATDKMGKIMTTRSPRTMTAYAEGSTWNHAWLGVVGKAESVLTLDDWQSLMVLAVLDGNRWFSVFTSMSRGHLFRDSASRIRKAQFNADVLYRLGEVASWFQPYATSLLESSPHKVDEFVTDDTHQIVRVRRNPETGEMWFAAGGQPEVSDENTASQRIALGVREGEVINMATGASIKVSDGVFDIPLTRAAQPYYFAPAD